MGVISPRLTALWAFSFSLLASFASAREEPLNSVADLRYGVALYHYHLDDYLTAMSELLVAEQRGGIVGHGENPEIMEAGLAMGYKMETYASEIFERILDQNRSVEVRDAAWFYLAKIRYSRGDYARVEEALAHLSAKPEPLLRQDANALRINLLLKQNKPEEANALLQTSDVGPRWQPYFWFNIGSSLAREGNYARAVGFFENLARDSYDDEEYRALYDKAMTAAGFCYLFTEDYESARKKFRSVRLTSTLSNRALLGYGWAALELGDYKEALKPWVHLSNSALTDENHQEAMIAVPFAYEKMGNLDLALKAYNRAEVNFTEEILRIETVTVALQADDFLTALNVEPGMALDWLSLAEEKQLTPNLTYLIHMFSRDSFQVSVTQLQDLLRLKNGMLQWKQKIDFYQDMLNTRETNRRQESDHMQLTMQQTNVKLLQQRHQQLSDKVTNIEEEQDFFALANLDEKDLIDRVLNGEQRADRLRSEDPFVDEYDENLRRYRGLLLWQASETYAERLWSVNKLIKQLDVTLADIEAREANVEYLFNNAPDLSRWRTSLADADKQIDILIARIDAAIAIADSELKEHVLAALAKQQDRLHNYMAQARLSIARLYDTARENHLEKSFTETKEAAEAAKEQRAIEAAQNPAKSLSNTPVLEQVKSIDETPVEAGVEALPADEGVTP